MRKGEVCGAVSGAIMVVGLKYGDGPDYKATAYPKAAEFMDKFKEKNTSYVCRDILGCDISSEEGMRYTGCRMKLWNFLREFLRYFCGS